MDTCSYNLDNSSLSFRARQAEITRNEDSLLAAVVDQLCRVGLTQTTVVHFKAQYVDYLKTQQNTIPTHDCCQFGDDDTHNNRVLGNLAEFLQRDIYIITGEVIKCHRFSRQYTISQRDSKSLNYVSINQSLETKEGTNRSVLLKVIDDRFFQSMEPYLAPTQLISTTTTRELSFIPETLSKLSNLTTHCGPSNIIVVCLIGTYRSGKSTLLNELIKQENAFSTSDGTETHTHGVWICMVEHGDTYVVYLDTEGTHDPRATNLGCVRMLLWCLSACSEFMYNYSSVVGEDIIRELFNLARIQQRQIRTNYRPSVRIILRNFQFELQGKSPTEYFMTILKTEEGDLVEEKKFLCDNLSHMKCYTFPTHPIVFLKQMNMQRQDLPRDVFAECINILENDLLKESNCYQAGNSLLNLREWVSNIQNLMGTINSQISTSEGDFIDLSQCVQTINKFAYNEALRLFRSNIVDGLYLEEFVQAEIDAWAYFTDNKVGNTAHLQEDWKIEVKNSTKRFFTIDIEEVLNKMYHTASVQNYLNGDEKVWNQELDNSHKLVLFYLQIFFEKIEVHKNRCMEQAIEAVRRQLETDLSADNNEHTTANNIVFTPEEQNSDSESESSENDIKALLDESSDETGINSHLQFNLDESASSVGHVHHQVQQLEQNYTQEVDENEHNLKLLFGYISAQNNFENQSCEQVLTDYSVWKPFRDQTIRVLTDISTSLDTMQKVTSSINVAAGTAGIVGGSVLLLSIFFPILAPFTLTALGVTLAVSGVSLINALTKLGITRKKAKQVTHKMEQDHSHTARFYQSLDRLVRESQGQTPVPIIDPEAPVEEGVHAGVRFIRVGSDAAEISLEVASAAGVAIGRGVAVGLGAIGIVVDVGMVAFSIVDLLKGSKHKLTPYISQKVAKLRRDSDIINNICFYTALHKIQLKLQEAVSRENP